MRSRLLIIVALVLGPAAPTQAGAAEPPDTVVAPGRVVLASTATAPEPNVDAGGATAAVALPDGGAVLAGGDRGRGLVLARVSAQGLPEPTFGTAGISRVALPAGGASVLQLLRRPDGRLLVVVATPGVSRPGLQVVGLTAQGFRDASFGDDGVAATGLVAACGPCDPVTLQPDGGLLAGGAVGGPGAYAGTVVRLTPDGAPDDAFGSVRIPGATGPDGGVHATSATASRITVLARGDSGVLLTALEPAGGADASFGAGRPQVVPDAPALSMLVHGDGAVDVLGLSSISRFAADGRPDRGFGAQGVVALPGAGAFVPPARLLAGGDASVLLVRAGGFEPRLVSDPSLVVRRVTRTGEIQAVGSPSLGFGGGYASPGRSTRLLLGGVDQDSFLLTQLLRRPDGGFLAVGGTRTIRYTGEGSGSSRGFFSLAGLTATLQPDPSIGGPLRPATARIRVPAQRAELDARTRRIRVRVGPTAPGLVLLRVRDRDGRVLGQVVAPLHGRTAVVVRVPLTADGRRLLARGRRTAVVVGHELRDLVGGTSAGSTAGTLR